MLEARRPSDWAYSVFVTVAPHFSKCYRMQFGYPPSEERKIGGRHAERRAAGDEPVVLA